MIDLGETSAKSKGFLVKFKSGHVGMVQRQLGVPPDKDYTAVSYTHLEGPGAKAQ